MPVVNQIERHPLLTQQPMVAYDTAHNIVTQAWSPLGRGVVLNNPMLKKNGGPPHCFSCSIGLKMATGRERGRYPQVQDH